MELIDIDEIINAFVKTGIIVIDIYKSLNFQINGHVYNGFVVLIGLLLFFFLVEHIWGGDDEE